MRQILKRIVETLVVIFGNCIYAFGIAMFILPSGLITGGTTGIAPVSYTHLRAHETDSYLVCRLLLEKKKNTKKKNNLY